MSTQAIQYKYTYIHTYLAYNTDICEAFAGLVSPDENEFN